MRPESPTPRRPLRHWVVMFTGQLRAAGIPVGVDQCTAFARATELIDPLDRSAFRTAARATLVTRVVYLPVFEELFDAFWKSEVVRRARGQRAPRAPRHKPPEARQTALMSFMADRARDAERELDIDDRTATASWGEVLQRKEFSTLTDDERRALDRAMERLRWDFARRRTRRLTPAKRGRHLDHRRVLRHAATTGGAPVALKWRSPKCKTRPLVLLADISGSMELYSRIVLQFFHGLARFVPRTESFVFGTRLTRITDALRYRSVDTALSEVSREIVDYAGGTRIGESLGAFNRRWAKHLLRRGAVVIVVSDGCERGEPTALDRELESIAHQCYRLIWLNPRLGHREYAPKVRGMSAALPHVDDFLPIHNMQSLAALADHLRELPPRPPRGFRPVSASNTRPLDPTGDTREISR